MLNNRRNSGSALHSPFVHIIIFVSFAFAAVFAFLISRESQPESTAQSSMAEAEFWEVGNGAGASHSRSIEDIEIGPDGTIWLGGSFNAIVPNTGSGIPISISDGSMIEPFVQINGIDSGTTEGFVRDVVPDGLGGWYIGGAFQYIDSTSHGRLAHILSDGTLDSDFNPSPDGIVYALYLSGTTLYVGGEFTNIGGEVRNRLAAINTTTNTVTAWNPNADNAIYTIAEGGGDIYIGGDFTTIGGTTRNRLAAVDGVTGALEAWDPNASARVNVIDIDGGVVYVGGQFTTINGATTRNRIAALDPTVGTASIWNPNASAEVFTLDADSANVYAGGTFTTIGGSSRNRIAALNTTDGTAIAWDPGIWGGTTTTVLDVLSTDDAIYVAGDFNRTGPIVAGSPTRNFIAAFDPTTGAETAWNPSASNKVYTMAISGTAMYIGGSFGGVNGVARSRIAAIDPITGEPTSCNPDVSAAVGQAIIVNDLLIDGTTLYVAGAFTSINGTSRNRIAAIDTTTCTLTTWNPSANSEVKAIDVDASNIYVGGAFTNIGGSVRNRIAAVSRTTGIATSWNPNANNAIDTLDLEGGTVYIGGRFTTIGGILRNRIAALSTAGVLSLWNPNSDAAVNSIDVDGAIIYVGGAFATIGGASRSRLAAIDQTTGLANAWAPEPDGTIIQVLADGSNVYVGGIFDNIGGAAKGNAAIIDAVSASAFPWNPSVPSGSVRAIVADDTNVYIGGAFNQVNTEVRNNFAVFGPVRVGFTDTSSESEEETTPANIEVSLSEEAAENVTVEFDAIGGTAAEGVDFTLPVSPLTISAGNTSVNIPVTIINNYVVENDKTIILEISSPTGAILGDNTLHTFTILNTDRSGILAPTINPPPSQPIAKYPQTMSKTSIRWNFYDTASNETGYRLSEIIDGSERIIFETGPEVVTNLLYLDETGLAPGTQYCNRYVIEFNGSGSSRATQLPCATTFPETIIETGETKTPNIVVNQEAFVVTEPNTVSASAASQAKTAASLTLVIAMFGLAHASYKRANLCSTKECKKMFSRYLLTALVSGAVVIAILRITAMPNPQAASFEPISQQTILKKYDHIKFIFTISNTGEATADDLVFRNSLPQEMKLVPQTTNLTKNNSITESISSDAYNKIAINIDNLLSNETSVVTFDATMASHLALFDNFGAVSGSNFPDTLSTGLPIYIDTSAIVTAPIIPSGKEIKPFDLIKTENEPAIYMVDVDYTRRPFLNERDLLSWYPSMTWAYIVSKTDMASIKIGHPMLYRPGTWLVKTQTNPAVYAVSQGNVLHWIPNETVAKELYGQLWNKKIVDVEDTMFSLYTIGGHVGNGQYPNNAVVNYRTSICYMQNEFCRPITTSGIRENRIFAEFILTVPIGSFSLPPEGTMIFDKEINLLSD